MMKKVSFNDEIIAIISDAANRIHNQDGFVGEKTYGLSLYEAQEKNKKAAYLTVSENDTLVCIKNVREDFDNLTSAKVIEDLCRRVQKLFEDGEASVEVSAVMSDDEQVDLPSQPIMLKLLGKSAFDDDKKCRMICAELNDWLDSVSVMTTTAESEKKKAESYKNDYAKIMTGGGLGREEEKDYSRTMSIISLILTIVSIFTYKSMFFPVMALMASGFSAYRCFVNKNIKGAVVCLICFVASMIFSNLGWIDIKGGLQAQIKK